MSIIAWILLFQSTIYLVTCKSLIYRCTCISCYSCWNSLTMAWEKSRRILPPFSKNPFPELIPVILSGISVFFKGTFYFSPPPPLERYIPVKHILLFTNAPFSLVRGFDLGTLCLQGGFCLPGLNASWTLQREPKTQISWRKRSNSSLYSTYPMHTYLIPKQATQQTIKAHVARILLS